MNYYYLASTLPTLAFGMENPPMTSEEFDALCAEHLAPEEARAVAGLSLIPAPETAEAIGIAGEFGRWETNLRNLIASMRAGALAEKYLRPEKDYFSEIPALVQQASGVSDMLTRERMVDQARWRKLDELEANHPFDFSRLAAYKFKLMILDKYRSRENSRGAAAFDELVSAVVAASDSDDGKENN